MKVLMQGRRDLFESYGGDSTQVLKTKEYLERLGVDVDVSAGLSPDVGGYDLVHIFNAPFYDVLSMIKNAVRSRKKIVYSPVYLDHSEYDRKSRTGPAKYLCKILGKYRAEDLKALAGVTRGGKLPTDILSLIKGYRRIQNEILRSVDFILPNSRSEIARLRADFTVGDTPCLAVPYAVDKNLFNEKPETKKELERFKGCLLAVAKVEGRKNQLNLIKAIRGLPYDLLLVGEISEGQRPYYEKLKKEAGKNVYFLGPVKHDDIPKYYSLAKVHCLVSWMETCGLSSMEAAIMGCNIVISDRGDTREYFRDYAYYCEPDSVESIKNAVIRAYNDPPDPALREFIMQNYSWEKAAEITLGAYNKVLNK
jgi:glycosyltransferase involved in cell wall biosynthesis